MGASPAPRPAAQASCCRPCSEEDDGERGGACTGGEEEGLLGAVVLRLGRVGQAGWAIGARKRGEGGEIVA